MNVQIRRTYDCERTPDLTDRYEDIVQRHELGVDLAVLNASWLTVDSNLR